MPDRLTAFDTSLVYAEDTATPMHIGSVAVFTRPSSGFDYATLVELVERRLALVPRYRQRLQEVPAWLARPMWVDDERFDIGYHVRRAALPAPGSHTQLTDLIGRLMSRRLDRERPLWELYLVEGLAGDRFAVITKTHAALVNGVDAMELGEVIFDPGQREPAESGWLWMPRPAPSKARMVLDAVSEAVTAPGQLCPAARSVFGDPTATARKLTDAVAALGSAVARPAPGLPLNARVGPQRRFATSGTSLADYRAVRAAQGGDVHDIVLTVLTGALRSWLASRGEQLDVTTLVRALVPLSAAAGAGRAVTPRLVDLPVGEPDPLVRLRHVRHQLRVHAESGRSVAARGLLRANGLAPATLHALGARTASEFTKHVFNVVVTNVPGPQTPLYAAGARMAEAYPVVPLLRTQALAVGVSSYDGGVYFGLNADRNAMSDVDNLGRMIEEALAELVETVKV